MGRSLCLAQRVKRKKRAIRSSSNKNKTQPHRLKLHYLSCGPVTDYNSRPIPSIRSIVTQIGAQKPHGPIARWSEQGQCRKSTFILSSSPKTTTRPSFPSTQKTMAAIRRTTSTEGPSSLQQRTDKIQAAAGVRSVIVVQFGWILFEAFREIPNVDDLQETLLGWIRLRVLQKEENVILISSDAIVQNLIYYAKSAKGCYKDSTTGLARNTMLGEQNILKFVKTSSVTRPGYYIRIDTRSKFVIFGIRGTYTVFDFITSIAASSDHELTFEGYSSHLGTAETAGWFRYHEIETLRTCLTSHEGFGLKLVGHSLGGAAAALLATVHRKKSSEEFRFSHAIVSAVGIATPSYVSKGLAARCSIYFSTWVLKDGIVPRVSLASLIRLRNEILQTDWTSSIERGKWKRVVDLAAHAKQVVFSVQVSAEKITDYAYFPGEINDSTLLNLLKYSKCKTDIAEKEEEVLEGRLAISDVYKESEIEVLGGFQGLTGEAHVSETLQKFSRAKKVMDLINFLGSKLGEDVNIGEVMFTANFNIFCSLLLSKELVRFEDYGSDGGVRQLVKRVMVFTYTSDLGDLFSIFKRFNRRVQRLFGKINARRKNVIKERKARVKDSSVSGQEDLFSGWELKCLFSVVAAGCAPTSVLLIASFVFSDDTASLHLEFMALAEFSNAYLLYKRLPLAKFNAFYLVSSVQWRNGEDSCSKLSDWCWK